MRPISASYRSAIAFVLLVTSFASLTDAADWPMWRRDSGRTAQTSESLPETLSLQWTRQLAAPMPAWPEDPRLGFDASLEPIVMGQTVFVASAATESVAAFDSRTGQERWRYYAEAPVRFAPVAHDGAIYFSADDGCLYCVDAASGELQWKFNGAPNNRKVLGNEQLVSVWPSRGGPVLHDGKIYYTAGIWPFEGTFLYAFDLAEGSSDVAPSPEITMVPEMSPQGYLVAGQGKLMIPGGRSPVACFDLATSEFVPLKYTFQRISDYHVVISDRWMFHGNAVVDIDTKKMLPAGARHPVGRGSEIFYAEENGIASTDLSKPKTKQILDRRGRPMPQQRFVPAWQMSKEEIYVALPAGTARPADDAKLQLFVLAGDRLYGHLGSTVFAATLPSEGVPARVTWTATLDKEPTSMLVADERLLVATADGTLHCFGGDKTEAASFARGKAQRGRFSGTPISPHLRGNEGYALVFGISDSSTLQEMVDVGEMNVIAIDPDAQRVAAARNRFQQQGQYGEKFVARVGTPTAMNLPAYLANLIVVEDWSAIDAPLDAQSVSILFNILRPYGGKAVLQLDNATHAKFAKLVTDAKLASAKLERSGNVTLLTREGELPGSANWTHEYGDETNSLMSKDKLVRGPLGLHWFGGPASNPEFFFDRHMWGPSAMIVDGRMYLQGHHKTACVDIYTGRIFWEKEIELGSSPGRRGNFYDGDHHTGYHFASAKDAVYLCYPDRILRLEATTGKTLSTFPMTEEGGRWGRPRVWEDLLIVSVFEESHREGKVPSKLIALDRTTGEVRWKHKATISCPVVTVGGGKVCLFDGYLEDLYNDIRRRGVVPKSESARYLKALDARTGELIWEKDSEQIVTWISYSEKHDTLITSNRKGIEVRKAKDGELIWDREAKSRGFSGHPESRWDRLILWKDRLIDQRGPGLQYDLLTGDVIERTHPITGKKVPWEFTALGHNCGYAIASEHMLTFRAGTAGYSDLTTGATARLPGFRSGCRNSLIPAGGILNAPNFAHGCSCSYSIFTSLAMRHVPEIEVWTYSAMKANKDRVQRLGLNLGAPGDRIAADGTLWLDYPSHGNPDYFLLKQGGPSPDLPIVSNIDEAQPFRKHASQLSGDQLRWVAASGVEGLSHLTIPLSGKGTKRYDVRLVFAEPADAKPGERVFDVTVTTASDSAKLIDLDVAKEAGGSGRVLVKTLENLEATDSIKVELKAKQGATILCGVEVVAR